MASKIDLLHRTLQLATLGLGKVSPHAMFGWVLASPSQLILAEGWLPNKPFFAVLPISGPSMSTFDFTGQNTLYVNILPTVTPDLKEFLSFFRISKVCVAGHIKEAIKLQFPDIFWEYDLQLKNELFLNRRFYLSSQQNRPYIILKWAETADGYVARKNYDSKWISSTPSRRLVHKWRTEEDAIMVATNTAHYDNPRLNARNWTGRNPVRIVIDRHLRLDKQLHLFDGSQLTICYNLHIEQSEANIDWVRIPNISDNVAFFMFILQDLWKRKIQSVIIEGGSQLLHFLIKHQLWDEAKVFTSSQNFGEGIPAPTLNQNLLSELSVVSNDILRVYLNARS